MAQENNIQCMMTLAKQIDDIIFLKTESDKHMAHLEERLAKLEQAVYGYNDTSQSDLEVISVPKEACKPKNITI